MDFTTSTGAAPALPPAPRPVADLRPAADAAATARITKPELPVAMPTPPATSQMAEVSRSMLGSGIDADASTKIAPVQMPERTLKPYGISMLPKSTEEAALDARAAMVLPKETATRERDAVQ